MNGTRTWILALIAALGVGPASQAQVLELDDAKIFIEINTEMKDRQ